MPSCEAAFPPLKRGARGDLNFIRVQKSPSIPLLKRGKWVAFPNGLSGFNPHPDPPRSQRTHNRSLNDQTGGRFLSCRYRFANQASVGIPAVVGKLPFTDHCRNITRRGGVARKHRPCRRDLICCGAELGCLFGKGCCSSTDRGIPVLKLLVGSLDTAILFCLRDRSRSGRWFANQATAGIPPVVGELPVTDHGYNIRRRGGTARKHRPCRRDLICCGAELSYLFDKDCCSSTDRGIPVLKLLVGSLDAAVLFCRG